MNKCFSAVFLRQDFLSIKECWFLAVVRILLYTSFSWQHYPWKGLPMNSFFLILALVPGCLLLPLSAEKMLEGVHGKTGFAKLPPATSSLPWKPIFNPGQFTHHDSQQHLIYSCPECKRKRQLQRKIHLELQFSQCLPYTPEQTWLRHSCFLWRDLQYVMPKWKQGFFAITTVISCFLFLKCYTCCRDRQTYKLTLYK